MIPFLSPPYLKTKNAIGSVGGISTSTIQALIDASKNYSFIGARSSAYGVSVVHDSLGLPLMASDGSTVVMKEPLVIELVVDSTGSPVVARC